MSTTERKLTKKQKKAQAFRDRKTGIFKAKQRDPDEEENDVPVVDIQDDAEMEDVEVEEPSSKPAKPAKGKRKEFEPQKSSKKRKREEETNGSTPEKAAPVKKKNKADGENEEEKGPEKQRFILFVGNLKYTTTSEAIAAHFAACDPPPKVRLLTPKLALSSTPANKSRGCAFLEFTHRNALQQGLKLHHSSLDGRMINVELTAGGGGKSELRISKLKERNKILSSQRKSNLFKKQTDGELISTNQRSQRYSATSGAEEQPTTRRTWTVGDVVEGETHRGGQKHTKKKKKVKDWSSGANSIPVG